MMAIEQTLDAVLLNVDQELEFDRILWIITDSQSAISSLQQGPTHVLQHSRITANAKLMREPLFDNYLSCSVDATF